ncbi:hypothetical protein VM94_04110 [Janthinobacterium sp. KBS0711]|nr:hypothetical protein VM94_04110 [Janthinobacterium sp. KBS0711]
MVNSTGAFLTRLLAAPSRTTAPMVLVLALSAEVVVLARSTAGSACTASLLAGLNGATNSSRVCAEGPPATATVMVATPALADCT